MKYISTRGCKERLSFREVLFGGLSEDGGLYVPECMPKISSEEFVSYRDLMFTEVTAKIIRKFVDPEELSDEDLDSIVKKAFSSFSDPRVVPLSELRRPEGSCGGQRFLLELFHGPTLAFKDVALQILGLLFEHFVENPGPGNTKLDHNKGDIVILGATSGDTGGAAIHSLKGRSHIQAFILYPKNMVSKIQELQMTTVMDDNIHTIPLECGFDKCQAIVKSLFEGSLKQSVNLTTINSINLVRIICQVSYYCYTALELRYRHNIDRSSKLRFVVPSGNFGDALAGAYAKMMGLPVSSIVMATNKNSALSTLLDGNHFSISAAQLVPTLSPAMDIILGSNLERFLWHSIYDTTLKSSSDYLCDAAATRKFACDSIKTLYDISSQVSTFVLDRRVIDKLKETVSVVQVTDDEILDVISKYYYSSLETSRKYGGTPLIVDPHTAVGVRASDLLELESVVDICLSTASPAKFPDTIIKAIRGKVPPGVAISPSFTFDESHFTPPEIALLERMSTKPPIDLHREDPDISENLEEVEASDLGKSLRKTIMAYARGKG